MLDTRYSILDTGLVTGYWILDNPNYRISGLQFIENRASSIEYHKLKNRQSWIGRNKASNTIVGEARENATPYH